MSQDIDFPDFPYFSVKYVHPNSHLLNNFMYPSVIERYLSNLELISDEKSPLPPRFGACRTNKSFLTNTETLTHKHRGSIPVRLISLALARPVEVGKLLARRRLPRISYTTRCGRSKCLHPLHLVARNVDPAWDTVTQPRKRSAGREVDWLTLPECAWLRHKMSNSFAKSLEVPITQVSEELGVHFSTLVDIWNQMVDYDRRGFYETFIIEGEHRL